MGLKERFNKLIGKELAPISERERWRCAVVRVCNLDHSGKPIDRHAGQPIAGRPEQSGYIDRVNDFLERRGIQDRASQRACSDFYFRRNIRPGSRDSRAGA